MVVILTISPLEIYICPDGNAFNKDYCSSYEEVKDLFDTSVYFSLLSQYYYFVPDNIENPLKLSFKNYYFVMEYIYKEMIKYITIRQL
jgi:hypothetical protein